MVDLPPPEPPKAPEPQEPEATEEAPEAEELFEADEAEEQEEAPEPSSLRSENEPLEAEVAEAVLAPDDAAPATRAKKNAYTALEISAQVHQVQEWLTYGKRPNQIRALCAEHWGLKTRAAEQRIHDARRQMVLDVNVQDRQEKVGQMLQQLEQVLEQSLAMRQGSNAIGALRLQADLLQLLARQN